MKARELTVAGFYKFFEAYWNKVYEWDMKLQHLKNPPVVFASLLEFNKRSIPGTPYWALYCKSFCERKPGLGKDFFAVPSEQKIGYAGPHLFMINAAPLCRYHSMFLPEFDQKLPQEITGPSHLRLVLSLLSESPMPGIKVVFNSTFAGASMRHLHFHLVDVEQLLEKGIDRFPIEKVDLGPVIYQKSGVKIHTCLSAMYPIPHFVVMADGTTVGCEIVAEIGYKVIEAIQKTGRPYNLIISDKGKTIRVVPRKEIFPAKIGRAVIECAGIQICLDEKVYLEMGQKEVLAHLIKIAISDAELEGIADRVVGKENFKVRDLAEEKLKVL